LLSLSPENKNWISNRFVHFITNTLKRFESYSNHKQLGPLL
jgi:hypothetical protein